MKPEDFQFTEEVQSQDITIVQKGELLAKYECLVCGWVYDPAVGDPDGGIKPGVPFEQLPDSWVCPVCGAGKDQFKRLE